MGKRTLMGKRTFTRLTCAMNRKASASRDDLPRIG